MRSFTHIPLGMIAGFCISGLIGLADGRETPTHISLWIILGLAVIGLVLEWRKMRRE